MSSVAEANLRQAGYSVFYPRIRNDAGEMEALFPRYFFVSCSGERKDIVKINHTRGVQRLMPLHLEEPLRLPDGYVDSLRLSLENAPSIEKAEEATVSFVKGQAVVVKFGHYAGIQAEFQRRKKGLFEIVFSLLGRPHVVCVPMQNVSALPDTNNNRREPRGAAPQFRRRRAA